MTGRKTRASARQLKSKKSEMTEAHTSTTTASTTTTTICAASKLGTPASSNTALQLDDADSKADAGAAKRRGKRSRSTVVGQRRATRGTNHAASASSGSLSPNNPKRLKKNKATSSLSPSTSPPPLSNKEEQEEEDAESSSAGPSKEDIVSAPCEKDTTDLENPPPQDLPNTNDARFNCGEDPPVLDNRHHEADDDQSQSDDAPKPEQKPPQHIIRQDRRPLFIHAAAVAEEETSRESVATKKEAKKIDADVAPSSASIDFVAVTSSGADDALSSCNNDEELEAITTESKTVIDGSDRNQGSAATIPRQEGPSSSANQIVSVSEHCSLESKCETLEKGDDVEEKTVEKKEDEGCNSADAKPVGDSKTEVEVESEKYATGADNSAEVKVSVIAKNEKNNYSATKKERVFVTSTDEKKTDDQEQETRDWEATTSVVVTEDANAVDTTTTQQREENPFETNAPSTTVLADSSSDACGVSPMASNADVDEHTIYPAIASPTHARLSDIPVVTSDDTHAESDITECCENDAGLVAIDQSCPSANLDGNGDCANDISSFPCYRGDCTNGLQALNSVGACQSSVLSPPSLPIPVEAEAVGPIHSYVAVNNGNAEDVSTYFEAGECSTVNFETKKDLPQSRIDDSFSRSESAASVKPKRALAKNDDDMCCNRIDAIKVDLYMECAVVHAGRGAEKLFAMYLERLGMYLVSTFDDSDEIGRMRSLPSSGGIQQFFQVFLTTRTLRRLHNELILELMKQAMLPTMSRKTFLDHAPEQWLSRGVEKREDAEVQHLKEEDVIAEDDNVASSLAKRAYTERRQDEDDILRLQRQFGGGSDTWNIWGGGAEAHQSSKDNNTDNATANTTPQPKSWAIAEVQSKEIHIPSPRLAGALVTDKIIGLISNDNLVVTDNATWLMVIAAREYTIGLLRQVVKDCKARQKSESRAEAMRAAAAGITLPPATTKSTSSKVTGKKGKGRQSTPKKKTTINPLDIALTVANNPYSGGGPHTFQPATRLAWESCICSANNAARSLLTKSFDSLLLDANRRMTEAEIKLRQQLEDETKAEAVPSAPAVTASSSQSASITTPSDSNQKQHGRKTNSKSISRDRTISPSALNTASSTSTNLTKDHKYTNGGPQHSQVEISSKPTVDSSKPTCVNSSKSSSAPDPSFAVPAPTPALRPAAGRGKGKNLAALRRKFSSKPPASSDGDSASASTTKAEEDVKPTITITNFDEAKDNKADDVSSQTSGSRPPSVTPLMQMQSKGKNAKNLAALRARSSKNSSPAPPPNGATLEDNKRAQPSDGIEETLEAKRPRIEGV